MPRPDPSAISEFGFRISDLPPPSMHPPPEAHCRRATVVEGLVARVARHSPGTGNLTVLATRDASSTVDTLQSASNAIYHSYLSERLGGRSPTWLSEGGWAGGGGGKRSSKASRRSNVARRRAKGAQRVRSSATDERLRLEGAATEAAWPRSRDRGRRADTETEVRTGFALRMTNRALREKRFLQPSTRGRGCGCGAGNVQNEQ